MTGRVGEAISYPKPCYNERRFPSLGQLAQTAIARVIRMGTVLTALFVLAALLLLMYFGGRFIHGYIYTDIPESLIWRAPAAAGAVWFIGLLWPLLFNQMTDAVWPINFTQMFAFSTGELTPPVESFIVPGERGRELTYKRVVEGRGHQYRENETGPTLPEADRLPPSIKVVTSKNESVALVRRGEGNRIHYVADDGRIVDLANGTLSSSSGGQSFAKILAGLLTLATWFVSLWLLLLFQWPHALGLAIPLFLVWGFLLNLAFPG